MSAYTYSQLEGLWIQAGGSQTQAPLMAAIAMAESGGNPDATNHNTNGTEDVGLWQINSVWGSLQTTDPLGNAQAAVRVLAQQGPQAWSTYSSGAYKQFLNGSVAPTNPGAVGVGIPTSDTTSAPQHSGSTCALGFHDNIPVIPHIYTQTVGFCLLSKSGARSFIGAALMLAGGGVLLVGVAMTLAWGLDQTSLGHEIVQGTAIGRSAKLGRVVSGHKPSGKKKRPASSGIGSEV